MSRYDSLHVHEKGSTVPRDAANPDTCPFIDENHPRCASQFRIDNLRQTLSVCHGGGYRGCPHYYHLVAKQTQTQTVALTRSAPGLVLAAS